MRGQANAGQDGRQYNCSFAALIRDWRAKWHKYTDGASDPSFPFGWAQLNSNGNQSSYTNPASAGAAFGEFGEWKAGYPALRHAQSSTLSLPKTFQATILDTPVASGSVHSPYKQPVGSRLARQGLAIAYGEQSLAKVDPFPMSARLEGDGGASSVIVTLGGLGPEGVRATSGALGFEVLGASDQIWHSTPITGSTSNSVRVGPAPSDALAVRYLWYMSPCGLKDFACPVYTDVNPLAALSGELGFLPLGPFVMKISVD